MQPCELHVHSLPSYQINENLYDCQKIEILYIQLFICNLNFIFLDISIFTTIHLFNPIDNIKKEGEKH